MKGGGKYNMENALGRGLHFSPDDRGGGGTPRPPTPQEIVQAIFDHAVGDGPIPPNVSTFYLETFATEGGSSVIQYQGGMGTGSFKLTWPTTLLPEEGSTGSSSGKK